MLHRELQCQEIHAEHSLIREVQGTEREVD